MMMFIYSYFMGIELWPLEIKFWFTNNEPMKIPKASNDTSIFFINSNIKALFTIDNGQSHHENAILTWKLNQRQFLQSKHESEIVPSLNSNPLSTLLQSKHESKLKCENPKPNWRAPCNNVLSRLNMFRQNVWQSAKLLLTYVLFLNDT